MKRSSRYLFAVAFVLLIAITVGLTGTAAADGSTLEEMEGDGTEDDPYVITNAEELQAMNENVVGHYVLGNDIDASETQTWNAGSGFEPIGDEGRPFDGSFDGQGHTISNLVIDRPAEDDVGLIGYSSGTIENVGLEDADVRGQTAVGSLVGKTSGEVRHASASGDVSGYSRVGGVVGTLDSGTVEMSSADADAVSEYSAGGLVGYLEAGSITQSHAHGDVRGVTHAGGITSKVKEGGTVQLSYATGDVVAADPGTAAGGIVGTNLGVIRKSFATGESHGPYDGGLTGGYLPDDYDAYITDSYWDIESTGHEVGSERYDVATGLRTDEMTGAAAEANMAAFDFEHFWTATDAYPVLQWQVQDVSVTLEESTVTGGDRTDVTVTVTLDDGSTVTASEVADYEADALVDADAGVIETDDPGTAEIAATVAGHSDTTTLEITEPPNIELEDVSLEAPAVVAGSEVTASATYTNDGGPGAHTAELIADGEVVATERVWLEADSETTVEFEWTPDGDAGTEYEVAIDEADLGMLTVVDPGAVFLESVSVPSQIGSGTPYEVTVELASDHDEPVLTALTYELEEEPISTDPVLIEPDGSTIAVEHGSDAATGQVLTHAVTLEGETLEETSEVAEPPAFEITDIDAPDEVSVGEAFDLTVSVENTGELEGAREVVVSADGTDLDATELVLEPGSSDTVTTSVTEDETGDYEYTVVTDDEETAAVSVAVEAGSNGSDDSETDGAESDDGSDGLPGFTAGITAVALLAIVTLARRRETDTRR